MGPKTIFPRRQVLCEWKKQVRRLYYAPISVFSCIVLAVPESALQVCAGAEDISMTSENKATYPLVVLDVVEDSQDLVQHCICECIVAARAV